MREPKPYLRKLPNGRLCWYLKLTVDGKRREIRLDEDKEKAQAKYHEIMAKHRKGRATASGSVARLMDLYWTWLQSNRAASTADRRKPILKSFGLHVGPKLTIDQLKPHHVNDWIEKCFNHVSDTRKNILITAIKTVLNWAVEMGYIESSPIAKMKKPQAAVREVFVPADLWQKVLDLASDQEFREWLLVMLETGARVEEMFRIEARHLDRETRRLVFGVKESKGRRRARSIYLPDQSFAIICRRAEERPDGKLFLNSDGNPWDKNSIRCRFRPMKIKLGIPNLTATALRHSYAYDKLDKGEDSAHVAELMGHVDTRMLMTRYGHLSKNHSLLASVANRTGFQQADSELPAAKAG